MKYTIEIEKILRRTIEIEAHSPTEAETKAKQNNSISTPKSY